MKDRCIEDRWVYRLVEVGGDGISWARAKLIRIDFYSLSSPVRLFDPTLWLRFVLRSRARTHTHKRTYTNKHTQQTHGVMLRSWSDVIPYPQANSYSDGTNGLAAGACVWKRSYQGFMCR